jgi:hypothetical protein
MDLKETGHESVNRIHESINFTHNQNSFLGKGIINCEKNERHEYWEMYLKTSG